VSPLHAVRSRPALLAGILGAAALAWWWTVQRMAGMYAGPGTDLGTLGWFTGSWALMMAAMMLPSFLPTVAAYVTLTRSTTGRWLLFTCGYLLVWTAAGLAAYGLFELGKDLFASELAWRAGGRWLSAAVLALAAAYQFTPAKRACLTRCRGQLTRRDGAPAHDRPAPLTIGVRSGGWCVGCSWALMAALFALGVMSVTWMVLIAALVAVEKVGPRPVAARFAAAGVLALLALGVLAAPHYVPGLVVPGSGAMHAMRMMR
jgi:predicted metal-binding membrane protein